MIRLREARAEDVGAIVALLADDPLGATREAPGDPIYDEAFAQMTRQAGNTILIAEDAASPRRLCGCLQLTIIHGLSRRGMARAQIEAVRVAAEARGAGIGRLLVEEAIARAQAAGCGLIQLTTDKTRTQAHR
ncbi:MAG: GNAT family N-acetyltransferase, partial [Pseudomonadota bacterium]